MSQAAAYAAQSPTSPLAPHAIDRRTPGVRDVEIDILFCGVCHSDLHTVRSEWAGTVYPVVPGHEIVGRVRSTGGAVTKFKQGQLVGVGCLVDSCRDCSSCNEGLEQYCLNGSTGTYGGIEKETGRPTSGGYSERIVVNEDFVLRVPESLDPAAAAPLLCAGITLYSPLRHWKAGKGKKVGIVGMGGLGHMGLKLAHAMGAHVALFTTSAGKAEDARRLGADDVVLSKDAAQMQKHAGSFDLIVNTVSVSHDLSPYLRCLRRDGTLVLLGVPPEPHASPPASELIFYRRSLAGSLIGGIAETQEMLDFCAEHRVQSDVEVIPIQKINEAYERMLKSDVRYRFSIDMSSLRTPAR